MKKSGKRRATPASCGPSVDIVITPQGDQITVQILTQGHNLGLEAPAQLDDQSRIRRWRAAIDDVALDRSSELAMGAPRGESFEGAVRRPGDRGAPGPEREQPGVEAARAWGHGGVRVQRHDRHLTIDVE